MAKNVTLTLDADVLDGARALAEADGLSLSTWLAGKVRREVRARNLEAYTSWRATNVDAAESAAFDEAARETAASSWAGSEW